MAGVLTGLGAFLVVRWARGGGQASRPANEQALPAGGSVPFDTLKGRWVRQDGYVIDIRDVDAAGRIDAGYLNPRPINVAKAQAARKDGTVEVFVELRDAGYPGCTYTLTYDPRRDRLTGVYYQAAAQERYAVEFTRRK